MNPFDGSGLVLAVSPLLGRASHPIARRAMWDNRIENTYCLGELRSHDGFGETYFREGMMEFNDFLITGAHHVRDVYRNISCSGSSFEHRQEIDGLPLYVNMLPVALLDLQGKISDWDMYLAKTPVHAKQNGDITTFFKEVHFWTPLYSCLFINVDKPVRGHIIVSIATQKIQGTVISHNITVEGTEKGIRGDSFSTGHVIYSKETIHEI